MLNVMKNIFSPDNWKLTRETADFDRERLERLQTGSSVEFGFMPQLALSAKRFKITTVRTYVFGEDRYLSFSMDHGLDHHVNMIVANIDDERYLAISRHISVDEALRLFSADQIEEVMDMFKQERIYCKEGVVGFLGWTANGYRKVMEGTTGVIVDGDYRDFPLPVEDELRHGFRYSLFVSDNDEYAIEIEQYDDGRVEMYATIYRRSTDIARVFPPVQSFVAPDPEEEHVVYELRNPALVRATPEPERKTFSEMLPEAEAMFEPVHEIEHSLPPITEEKFGKEEKLGKREKSRSRKPSLKDAFAEVEETAPATAAAPVPVASAPIEVLKAPAAAKSQDHMLACDVQIANKIFDEAIRNQMTLSELIRRVLDLRTELTDTVYIPIPLSERDMKQLGRRYGINPADKEAIHRHIIDELASFAGEPV